MTDTVHLYKGFKLFSFIFNTLIKLSLKERHCFYILRNCQLRGVVGAGPGHELDIILYLSFLLFNCGVSKTKIAVIVWDMHALLILLSPQAKLRKTRLMILVKEGMKATCK